ARWFSWGIGELALEHLRGTHAELALLYGPAVPLDTLAWRLLTFVGDPATAGDLDVEARRRWEQILLLDPTVASMRFSAADLAGPVAEAFAAPAPAWYAGRHQSPDVMIAARDIDAIARGEYEFVLGEVHTGAVTVDSATHNWIEPAPHAIRAPSEAALDDGLERYVPLYRRGMARVTARSYPVPESFSDRYRYLSFGPAAGEREVPDGCRLEMSAMHVVDGADGLVVTLPDGSARAALVVVGEMLSLLNRAFGVVPRWPHTPRVTVDRLVVARETWRVPAEDFAVPRNRPDPDPIGRVTAVADRHGLPRRTFWRARSGTKPVYLDLHSPLLVRLAAASLRDAVPDTSVTFTEMLPGPDQLWLADAQGRRYTSELRLTLAEGPTAGSHRT
ncbi:MAG: lantibiotic dehydratase family protein, partial [Actinomycetota bacterium]|nr:lantibiotic dehydratase family protein [Actinomycetota bacterium]